MATLNTPQMFAEARALIARAEAQGFSRGVLLGCEGKCPDCLFADADAARDYLARAEEPDPERCGECGALEPCDCLVYLA